MACLKEKREGSFNFFDETGIRFGTRHIANSNEGFGGEV